MQARQLVVALVDGEHHPPVVRAAIEALADAGKPCVAAVVLGGTEKVQSRGADLGLGIPTVWAPIDPTGRPDVDQAVTAAVALAREHGATALWDLSDEPVVDERIRGRLIARTLVNGLAYHLADASFWPPQREASAAVPTIAVAGTAKRAGKTAVTGALARQLAAEGATPVIVAMGRGGPAEPLVIPAGAALRPEDLLAVAARGGHAASDLYEDAATSGVAAVGARRCGGGLAGGVAWSTVPAALAEAEALGPTHLVLDGSGAALPPAHADVTLMVVPADADSQLLTGGIGQHRLLCADAVVVTMCEPPRATPAQVRSTVEAIRSVSRAFPLLRTVLRPFLLEDVRGQRVVLATTAPPDVATGQAAVLTAREGCEVVAVSSNLAHRSALADDLRAAPSHDVLCVELKAAAVDVAMRIGAESGSRLVLCANRPEAIDGDDEAIANLIRQLAHQAGERATERTRP